MIEIMKSAVRLCNFRFRT